MQLGGSQPTAGPSSNNRLILDMRDTKISSVEADFRLSAAESFVATLTPGDNNVTVFRAHNVVIDGPRESYFGDARFSPTGMPVDLDPPLPLLVTSHWMRGSVAGSSLHDKPDWLLLRTWRSRRWLRTPKPVLPRCRRCQRWRRMPAWLAGAGVQTGLVVDDAAEPPAAPMARAAAVSPPSGESMAMAAAAEATNTVPTASPSYGSPNQVTGAISGSVNGSSRSRHDVDLHGDRGTGGWAGDC